MTGTTTERENEKVPKVEKEHQNNLNFKLLLDAPAGRFETTPNRTL